MNSLKRHIICIRIVSLLASLLVFTTTLADNTDWVFKRANACLNPNNITHVAAKSECLAIQTYFGKTVPAPHPVLLVFIHGDGIPGGGPSDYLKFQATKFSGPQVVPVVLIRPGYYDSYNNYSTGESHAFDCNGYPCDGYRDNTVATLAAAVKQLQTFYSPRCTVLIGHSGGAMMSAVILGKYPNLANGAVLASMVGDVHLWAQKHGWGTWSNSLSPDDWVSKIPERSFIYIISGTADTNTYPTMTTEYDAQLQQHHIAAKLISVKGGDHNSVVLDKAQAFDNAITDAIKDCK